jgi:hypothetical protein
VTNPSISLARVNAACVTISLFPFAYRTSRTDHQAGLAFLPRSPPSLDPTNTHLQQTTLLLHCQHTTQTLFSTPRGILRTTKGTQPQYTPPTREKPTVFVCPSRTSRPSVSRPQVCSACKKHANEVTQTRSRKRMKITAIHSNSRSRTIFIFVSNVRFTAIAQRRRDPRASPSHNLFPQCSPSRVAEQVGYKHQATATA